MMKYTRFAQSQDPKRVNTSSTINCRDANKSSALKNMRALGRMKAGTLNKTEQAYADELERQKQTGEIAWFEFEAIKLRLADRTFLTVDFFLMRSDGALEAHDVKGFLTEDAAVKMKVAASKFPFPFFYVRALPKKAGGGFSVEGV